MTVIPLPSAARSAGARPMGAVDPRLYATNIAGLMHEATAPLWSALEDAVRTAAASGTNDVGARQAADSLRDARIALELAVAAAGRRLADRELSVRRAL